MLDGVRQFSDEEQLAWIEQADQIRDLRRSPVWMQLASEFASAGVPDLDSLGQEIEALGEAARATRVARNRTQAEVRVAADEVDVEVRAIEKWVDDAHAAIDYLRARRDPAYPTLARVLFRDTVDATSGRTALDALDHLVPALEAVGDLSVLRLPPSFLDEGRRMRTDYVVDRQARHGGIGAREIHTRTLRAQLADLVNAFEALVAAKNLVTQRTGVEPVALQLAYLRAAEGPAGGGPRPAPVAAPLPPLAAVTPSGVVVG